jgi:carbamoyl-phosphate synthase small subunit
MAIDVPIEKRPPVEEAVRSVQATLYLADGTSVRGEGLGSPGTVTGEMVFTTAMTGYGEALTDPSYRGQILMFTYPLIGNYGSVPSFAQSREIHARGAILSTLSDSWAGRASLASYLLQYGVPAMYGVDTRALAQHIRSHGAMPAVLALHEDDAPTESDLRAALTENRYDTTDFVAETTIERSEVHGSGSRSIALLDCGNKQSVTEELLQRDATVTVLPAHASAADILALGPDGLVISNGPGNPQTAAGVIETVRALYGRLPMFGICLGHQILALAAGATTFKLKFGHRGANHPVIDCESGRAFITTQNHGFAVDPDSLPPDLLVSHRNLNDNTVEGLRHRTLPICSVQFHPEGSPGPRDAGVLLDEWMDELSVVSHQLSVAGQ